MKLQKIITFLVIGLALVIGAFYYVRSTQDPVAPRCEDGFRFVPSSRTCEPVDVPEDLISADFARITFKVPGSSAVVTLKQEEGTRYAGSYTDPEFESSEGFISLDAEDVVEFSDGLILIPFVQNGGGTGNFVYVALVDKIRNEHLSSVFVGDRIGIDSIETVGEIAQINYKTRLDTEGYSFEPTIPAQLVAEVKGKQLELVMRLQNAVYSDVELRSPRPRSDVSGSLALTGSIPGNWYFEANATYRILGDDLTELKSSYIKALSDWMTTQRVPFDTEIDLKDLEYVGTATVVVESHNAEGGEEGARKVKKIEVPVMMR